MRVYVCIHTYVYYVNIKRTLASAAVQKRAQSQCVCVCVCVCVCREKEIKKAETCLSFFLCMQRKGERETCLCFSLYAMFQHMRLTSSL
jgi:hypothetical protein